MIFDIQHEKDCFVVKFKAKDIKTEKDKACIAITCDSLAHSFCFEARELYEENFKEFLNNLAPRKTHCVIVGYDEDEDPLVAWGTL